MSGPAKRAHPKSAALQDQLPSPCLVLQSAMRRRAWPKVAPVGGVRRAIYTFSLGRRRMSTSERARLFRSAWRFPFQCDVSAARFNLDRWDQGGRSCATDIFVSWRRPGQNPCLHVPRLSHFNPCTREWRTEICTWRSREGRTFFSLDGEADHQNRCFIVTTGPVLGQCWASAYAVSSATSAEPVGRGLVR